MCHNPATLFDITKRGFIRNGYKADLTLVSHDAQGYEADSTYNRCGWNPFEGNLFHWRVEKTFVNGHIVFDEGRFDTTIKGQQVTFTR